MFAMDNFRVTLKDEVTIIEDIAQNLIVKVERNRVLTEGDKGAILETFLFSEEATFVGNGSYIFEVVDRNHAPKPGSVDINVLHAIVDFFYHSIMKTSYFLKRIPVCSCMYQAPDACYENINNIQVSRLYEILSGY